MANYVRNKKSGLIFLYKINSIPIDEPTLDLLQQMLTLDPEKRISAEKALLHNYFVANPLPTEIP